MRRSLGLFIGALATVFLWGCGSGPGLEVESRWNDGNVIMDGSAEDWAGLPLEYSEEEGISFGVRNDDESIYFIFLSREERLVRKVHIGGMILWFDAAGGTKKEFGVRYWGNRSLMEDLRAESGFPGMMTPEQRAMIGKRESEILDMITVIEGAEEIPLPEDSPTGPQAASGCRDGIFGYEFRIPIASDGSIPYAVAVSPGEMMSVCFELGGIDKGARERMMKERRGVIGPPGGGIGDGGKPMEGTSPRRGSPGVRPGGEREEMMKKQEVWVTLHLAQIPPVETRGK